ncbi:hypothetical protein [Glaciihabitans sp. dw_435]|uniref:hypothetical protein n=1 Tax=Glaciihabitans sp. dw_435 TaxID=2720081 RepID=UPI001BD3A7A4|nr:hypothetical protein [Glaciihabitans sp. dw_435]
MTTDLELSRLLTRAAEAVPGVFESYPAANVVTVIAATVAEVVVSSVGGAAEASAGAANVAVERGSGRVDLHANVCIRADHSVPVTLRAVSEALATVMAATEDTPAYVHVRASRIE